LEDPALAPIYTVGHSTHSLLSFIEILTDAGIVRLADVRTVPRSRHNPQFNRDTLPQDLRSHGVAYVHTPELGGLRRPRPDSKNLGWRNASFRGYADYMETVAFVRALEDLERNSRDVPTVVMCAEAVPWRCHRSLIADALVARGASVRHLMKKGVATPHRLTSWAVVRGGRPTYPASSGSTTLDDFEPSPPSDRKPLRRTLPER
jgi:uncharacterized protein (DUF488 family)